MMSDFPIMPIHQAMKQIVPLGTLYKGNEPIGMHINAIFLSKNFGPFYQKPIDAMLRRPGITFLTLEKSDTDSPGFLLVQLRSKEQYYSYWFSIGEKI